MKLKASLANVERLIRGLVVAPAACIGAALAGPDSVVGIVLLAVTAVMLATALLSSCAVALLGNNTRSRVVG